MKPVYIGQHRSKQMSSALRSWVEGMRVCPKVVLVAFLSLFTSGVAVGQLSLPGFGPKNAGSNDQKASALLHEHLPLVLDANTAYPTVPDGDLLGGPFHGHNLPITLDTLTKPLPPGDYVLPMTFFCSEYSIHRPGAGTAYVLAPAKGTAARAISTLLWRGMLTGHKPQELQSVSWAIQGSVAYDKMPATYRKLVDELIPDMKNQVNGQAFADIEDGFQGKVNRFTRKVSEKATEGLGKVTGGRGRVDIKVDVELNQSFGHLGRLGQMALDGESISNIVQAANLTDTQREQALYAGQGTQAPPLPAANGPWSVMVPGVAYMRFVVHSGNLRGDNVMQIRILKPQSRTTASKSRPHLTLAQYTPVAPAAATLSGLFNGSVDQDVLTQCQAAGTQTSQCAISSMSFGGLTAYSVGTGDQAPIMTAAEPLGPASNSVQFCVKKLLYQPVLNTFYPHDKNNKSEPNNTKQESVGLCIFLGAVSANNGSCEDSTTAAIPTGDVEINWVQTYITNSDANGCAINEPHKDECKNGQKVDGVPFYRTAAQNNLFNSNGSDFHWWAQASTPELKLLFRDIPGRPVSKSGPIVLWHTANDMESKGALDNDLRFVSSADASATDYTALIQIKYGFHINPSAQTITVEPLVIGGKQIDNGGIEAISDLRQKYQAGQLPLACTNSNPRVLSIPKLGRSNIMLDLPATFTYSGAAAKAP